ncbi:MAG: S1 RNA-binding domain-containing protein [Bacillota bacterium]
MSSAPIQVGSIVEGVITGITSFGAFVELPNGKTGLVHISEVADAYVKSIEDYVKENDRVKVKVLSFGENDKIALSIRQAQPGSSARRNFRDRRDRRGSGQLASFEDRLAKFLKESDEKQSDLRKQADSKRGGRGRSFW